MKLGRCTSQGGRLRDQDDSCFLREWHSWTSGARVRDACSGMAAPKFAQGKASSEVFLRSSEVNNIEILRLEGI